MLTIALASLPAPLPLQVHAAARRVQALLEGQSADYLQRCAVIWQSSKEAAKAAGSKHLLVLPRSWPQDPNFIFYRQQARTEAASQHAGPTAPPEDAAEQVAEDAAMATERAAAKFLPLSSGLLQLLLRASNLRQLDLPFQLTSEQASILQDDLTKFVLGRCAPPARPLTCGTCRKLHVPSCGWICQHAWQQSPTYGCIVLGLAGRARARPPSSST